MPLIVKVNPGLSAKLNDPTEFVDSAISPPSEPAVISTERTELIPKIHHRRFRKEVARKLRQKLKMRRLPVLCLILSEVFERFAYYGIVINFVLFLDTSFDLSMFVSAAAVFCFSCVSWFMCALGGLVADSRFGRYSTIVSGFAVYLIGTFLLVLVAMWIDIRNNANVHDHTAHLPIVPWLVLVLLSIAAGEGAVKANLSAFGADQLKRESHSSNSKTLFNCFYWVSNVVSLLALAGLTYLQQTRWHYAFTIGYLVPASSLSIAVVMFVACRKHFVISGPCGTGLRNVWFIVRQAWSRRGSHTETRELALTQSSQSSYGYTKNSDWLGKATVTWGGTFLESEVNEVRSLWKVFVFSTFLIPYWMIYVQLYGTFILQGFHLEASYNGFTIPTAWMSLFDIVTLLIFVPVMERGIYPALSKFGMGVPMLWRIVVGMLLAAGSVGMAGYNERSMADHFNKYGYVNQTMSSRVYPVVKGFSIFWQIPQYTLLGMSEVFASMSGLQLVFSLCPTTPQSVTSAIYNFMICIGSFLSFCLFVLVAYKWDWYPKPGERELLHYLGNVKGAYYHWLLAGIAVITVLLVITAGYCFDIGLIRKTDLEHQLLVNEEESTATHTPDTQTTKEDTVPSFVAL